MYKTIHSTMNINLTTEILKKFTRIGKFSAKLVSQNQIWLLHVSNSRRKVHMRGHATGPFTFQFLLQVTLSQTHGKGSSFLFITLSTHTCVCLHWLILKLAKVIKISHLNRPKITLKCCWHRVKKNRHKNR